MPISCLAIVGPQSNPIYLRCFPTSSPERDLRLNFIVHCSLDAFEQDKVHHKRAPGEAADPYLGLLYSTQEFRAYGYLSNTNTRFIAVLDDAAPAREEAASLLLRGLHALYVDAFSNPFFAHPLGGGKFEARVDALADSAGEAA
ncbi:hypothetical protein FOA52_011668 [Chlamydomonas sp. UWO 241]|nr:hypothetical protein FOA52_011668 [Chlamydomonas sp. UWO 241]